jgi:formylglycine-generating enzyme required for sulfatase activity
MLGSSRLKGKSSFTRQWFVEPRAGITLVYIPKNATFRMRNIDFARNRSAGIADDGKLGSIPASVTIPRGFLISMTEITESQFAELGKMPARTEPEGPAFGIGAVTWSEAASFCNRLTQAESQYCYKEVNPPDLNGAITFDGVNEHLSLEGYRLPTEAEWEYTCRGGTNTPFSYGTDPEMLPLYAWIGDSRDEVGSLRPNSFGLFDCHGGLAEWCDDSPARYPPGAERTDYGRRSADKNAKMRIVRGGHYQMSICNLRSFASFTRKSDQRHWQNIARGFRIARTVHSFPP